VKDHAERTDMELTEAYCDVLERGLEDVEHPDQS
jgi:hypothetical protein